MSRLLRRFRSVAALAALASLASLAPASAKPPAAQPAKVPAPPCTAPALPGPVATRFAQLGGIERFGCAVDTAGPVYKFRNGQIEAVPTYGSNATYAAIVDASDVFHVYLSGTDPAHSYDQWLVRLEYDGGLVNQVAYQPGTGDVGGTYANDILVHPSGRHGTLEISMEGCFKSLFGQNSCIGWSQAVLQIQN